MVLFIQLSSFGVYLPISLTKIDLFKLKLKIAISSSDGRAGFWKFHQMTSKYLYIQTPKGFLRWWELMLGTIIYRVWKPFVIRNFTCWWCIHIGSLCKHFGAITFHPKFRQIIRIALTSEQMCIFVHIHLDIWGPILRPNSYQAQANFVELANRQIIGKVGMILLVSYTPHYTVLPTSGTLHSHSRNLSSFIHSLDTCGAREPCIVVYCRDLCISA